MAGLDSLTSGRAFIGEADLSTLNDHQLTILRRDHVGFVFQAYNLVPTITAGPSASCAGQPGGRS
jgi:putative ABC transport system ATP-binding protein